MAERNPPDDRDDAETPPPFDYDAATPDPGGAGPRGLLPDAVKKALLAGVGALFMTEESARRLARDWKLPKDVINFIGAQAQGAKDEILRVLSDEIRRFLESEAVRREFWKALSAMAIEVKAEIRLKPSAEGGAPRPKVKAQVRAARKPRKGKAG